MIEEKLPQIIINADDYGISPETSQTIIKFMGKGYCDTTSVMINMPGAENAAALAKEAGTESLTGLHINLTQGPPLTNGIAHSSIFAGSGAFGCYKQHKVQRFFLDKKTQNAVRDELRAQMECYLALGYTAMHIDSHQGIHMDRSIFPLLLPLCEEYGFKKIRRSPNIKMGGSAWKNGLKRAARQPYDAAVTKSKLTTTDLFGSLRDFPRNESTLPSGAALELMVHPVTDRGGVQYIDYYSGLKLDDWLEVLARAGHGTGRESGQK